jgi:hypothetical protein
MALRNRGISKHGYRDDHTRTSIEMCILPIPSSSGDLAAGWPPALHTSSGTTSALKRLPIVISQSLPIVIIDNQAASAGEFARSRLHAIVGGSIGNLVEWYDLYVYFYWYVSLCMGAAMITALTMRDTMRYSRILED